MHDRIREWYDAFAASLATHDSNSAARQHGRNSAAAFREAVAPVIADIATDPDETSLRWEPAVQTCTRYAARDVSMGGSRSPKARSCNA